MKFENSITIYTTEDAKKKENKPKQNRKSSCPSCEIREIKNNKLFDVEIYNDYINKGEDKE
jgi:hypothetical protein